METTKVFFNRWVDKEDMVHIYNGILLTIRKYEILPFATTWMNLENIMLSKISQQKLRIIYFTHMWDIKLKVTNKPTRQTNKENP